MKWLDKDKVYGEIAGDICFIEEHALIVLLREQVLFMSYGDKEITELLVLCNDLFYWGTADCETLPYRKLEEVYKAYKNKDKWAVDKWCCKQRNLQPQVPVAEQMKKDGAWEDWLEQLPKPEPS